MKLIDLHEETINAYIRRLKRIKNIRGLGSGYYSEVFQHPTMPDVAVKLCVENDPLAIMYLRETEKHPANPWFPKIFSIHKVQFHAKGTDKNLIARDLHLDAAEHITHIVFMEKLKPASKKQYKNARELILDSLPEKVFRIEVPTLKDYSDEAYLKHVKVRRAIMIQNDREHRFLPPRGTEYALGDIHLFEWRQIAKYSNDDNIRQLAEVLVRVRAQDIHDKNVMIRPSDGHPVITDPVAS